MSTPTLRDAAEKALAAFDAHMFLNDHCGMEVEKSGAVPVMNAVETLRAELAKPDARPAPAEPQPAELIVGHSPNRGGWCVYSQQVPGEYALEMGPFESKEAAEAARLKHGEPAQAPQPAGGEREAPADILTRLRNTPNWMRESYGSWKDCVLKYDRAPFEAAEEIERLRAALSQPAAQQERKPLTDEQIERIGQTLGKEIQGVSNYRGWPGMGYSQDASEQYTIPNVPPIAFEFARAIEAAHGISPAGADK